MASYGYCFKAGLGLTPGSIQPRAPANTLKRPYSIGCSPLPQKHSSPFCARYVLRSRNKPDSAPARTSVARTLRTTTTSSRPNFRAFHAANSSVEKAAAYCESATHGVCWPTYRPVLSLRNSTFIASLVCEATHGISTLSPRNHQPQFAFACAAAGRSRSAPEDRTGRFSTNTTIAPILAIQVMDGSGMTVNSRLGPTSILSVYPGSGLSPSANQLLSKVPAEENMPLI